MPEAIKALIAKKAAATLKNIMTDSTLKDYVASERIPAVFIRTDDPANIRLIIIGQDPTVKKEADRAQIHTVLNLDKPNSRLYKYIHNICVRLDLDMKQQVYATNYGKNFFVRPPTQIREINILREAGRYWIPLLKEELAYFPDQAQIITLGEPLLKALSINSYRPKLRHFWGYTPDWQNSESRYSFVGAAENLLARNLYPLPHQPSLQKMFYQTRLDSYLAFIRKSLPDT